ncbi:MAG: shikimate dehydrogenase [Candidatus Omnitrophota bacterium]
MKPEGRKELYGLIGYPVKHSYSPLMHNAAFKKLGINAEYRLFEVPPQGLEGFFKKTIFEEGIKGFNVTVPHKETALGYLTGSVSSNVKMIGAVNTVLVREDGRLDGFNTDETGFTADFKAHNVQISGKIVALMGAGGGAKAVAFGLAGNAVKGIRIFDVDFSRSQKLADNLLAHYRGVKISCVKDIEGLDIPQADILINATPVGMKADDPLLVKQEWLHKGLFVYDLIYNPAETKLLAAAGKSGCLRANGLGMLLHQGALAFAHWRRESAPLDAMRTALWEGIHG